MPIFPAESTHRYNATCFAAIDPIVGGRAALQRLADALHERGIRMLGDVTTNHCGDTHEWFVTAQSDESSPERSMFYFEPDGSYACWADVPTLPKLNWGSPLVRERMAGVLQQWLTYYDGWRVDVAHETGRYRAEDRTREVASLLRRALHYRQLALIVPPAREYPPAAYRFAPRRTVTVAFVGPLPTLETVSV